MTSDVVSILKNIGTAGANEDGSYTRDAYSKEYFQAVDVVKKYMTELGMKVTLDAAGNVRGILEGSQDALPHILLGSHLDTVTKGGLYDGAYGVAGALAALFQLKDANIRLNHTIEIYGFNGEENALGGTFGSRALAGLIDVSKASFVEDIKKYRHTPEEIKACKRNFNDAKCYIELHIEQGERLDAEGLDIGVVSGIVGITRYKVTALGKSNHAGTTQMFRRRDALVGMSKLIVQGNELCRQIDKDMVFTVGTIECYPGAKNVVPGKVECYFEMRHLDKSKTDHLIESIKEKAREIQDCEFTFEQEVYMPAALCKREIMNIVEDAAADQKLSSVVMPSGAGHDADSIAHHIPIGMIFVPSKDGLSHCKEEWTSDEQLLKGVQVLSETLKRIDESKP